MNIPSEQEANLVMWAMDMENGNPVMAHRVVKRITARGGKPGEVRVTACGLKLTAKNHPEGWWRVPKDQLPLQVQNVHCGIGL